MYSANLLGNGHWMVGRDIHTIWPFGSPTPAGFVPHGCFMTLDGVTNLTVKKAEKIEASYNKVIQHTSDIGNLIPHLPPIHILSPLIIAFSGSKSQFGVSTVFVDDEPVAVAVAVIININMNCSEPSYTNSGIVFAMSMTCQAGFTLADFVEGLVRTYVEKKISLAMFRLGEFAGNVLEAIMIPVKPSILRPYYTKFYENSLRVYEVGRHIVPTLAPAIAVNLGIGTPLGYSSPNSGDDKLRIPEAVDNIADEAHDITNDAYNAVHDYFSNDTDVIQ